MSEGIYLVGKKKLGQKPKGEAGDESKPELGAKEKAKSNKNALQ